MKLKNLLRSLFLLSLSAFATKKALPPHVHGELALHFVGDSDKKQIQVKLEIPGMNVFGFEHKPTNAAEKKIVATGNLLLKDPSNIFIFKSASRAENCELANSKIHEGKDEDGGSDFDLEYNFTCKNLADLENLEITGFKNLKNLQKVHAEGLWGQNAKKEDLTPSNYILSLK